MTETMVSVGSNLEGRLTINLATPTTIKNAFRQGWLDCRHDELNETARAGAATWVQTYGCSLWTALLGHDAIKEALMDLMQHQAPLYFQLENPEAERFFWETLSDRPGHFIALDANSPICRVVHQDNAHPRRPFSPPLRVLAILSAHKVRADVEWQGLERAFTKHADEALPLRLHVLVSEDELHEEIRLKAGVDTQGHSLGNGGFDWLSVDRVPRLVEELLQEIGDYRPNILHLFCHGRASAGQATIELASPLDWEEQEPREPLILEVEKLRDYRAFPDLWFAMLNCCGSGAATEEVHSLTAKLVGLGLPAAVGMREPVSRQAANDFSRAFYAALIPELIRHLDHESAPGEPAEIDWGRMLRSPRGVLSDRYRYGNPASHHEWTLPVLYVGDKRLHIDCRWTPPSPSPGTRQRAAVIREAIAHLPPEATPPGVLARLRAELGGTE